MYIKSKGTELEQLAVTDWAQTVETEPYYSSVATYRVYRVTAVGQNCVQKLYSDKKKIGHVHLLASVMCVLQRIMSL